MSNCKKANSDECNRYCRAYILMEAIYSSSNIPKKYQRDTPLSPPKADLESFRELQNFKLNVLDHVENGNNLFIYSKGTGNGKTTWGSKILNEYIKKKVFSKDIENLIYFVNMPELMESLRVGYDDGSYSSIIDKIQKADIVLFDDIGAEKGSEWVRERIYTILNYRIVNCLSCIYTSNLSIEDIRVALGDRVASRILDNTVVVELIGADRRGL